MGFFDKFKKAVGKKEKDSNPYFEEPSFEFDFAKDSSFELDPREDSSFDSKEEPSSKQNFKYLDNLIHSGLNVIVLDSDIRLAPDERERYEEGINLDLDDLIIDGNGHAIDACSQVRIFLSTGKNIILKNITLKNGNSRSGGAISNSGELTISNSIFQSNQGHNGGAISNAGDLTVHESNFNQNTAIRREMGQGGAIYNTGIMNISNSSFHENESDDFGGAVYLWKGSSSNISDCEFIQNTVGAYHGKGGAISNWGNCNIQSSLFRDNSVTGEKGGDGGAINSYSGSLNIKQSVFEGNKAQTSAAAIWNRSELNIEDSIFTDNDSPKASVAYNSPEGNFKAFSCEVLSNRSLEGIITNKDSLQIHNTAFKSNSSTKNLIFNDEGGSFGIFSCEFMENSAPEAILYNGGKFCSLEKAVFDANMSTIDIMNGSDLSLTDLKIMQNGERIFNSGHILIKKSSDDFSAKVFGDGTLESIDDVSEAKFDFGYLDRLIHESDSLEVKIEEDISFEGYERDFYEGGIELDIDGLTINGNGRTIDGRGMSRIFFITGKDITLRNIVFKRGISHRSHDNPFNSSGGALRVLNHDGLKLENCRFIECTSEDMGGAIYTERNSILNLVNCDFESNSSKGHGGSIFCQKNCHLDISHSNLIGNKSRDLGGAIYSDEYGLLKVSDCGFESNESSRGGGIYTEGHCSLDLDDCGFINNKALTGAAIQNGKDCEFKVSSTGFGGNDSKMSGGAIYNKGSFMISDSTFSRNSAGGSFGIGGGAAFNEGHMSIIESKFSYNIGNGNYPGDGGSLYNKGQMDISSSRFEENSATSAGAIRNDSGFLEIKGSELVFNRADERGGAISNSGELNIDETLFNENLANEGGAIENGGNLNILKSNIIGNLANENGAGIYNHEKANIQGSVIKDNVADYYGGAAYNANGDLRLEDVHFEDITSLSNEVQNEGRLVIKGEFSTNQKKPIINNSDVYISSNEILERIDNSGRIHELKSSKRDFSYLDSLIHSGLSTIELDSDIVLNIENVEDRKYGNGIKLDIDGLIIDGNGHSIDAQSMARIFECLGKNIILKNIELLNGYAETGGAILNEGELSIEGLKINGNKAIEGGAVYNSGSLNIKESVLNSNESEHWGGAIYNEGSLSILGSVINDNTARESGGAIYSFDIHILIEETNINFNRARKGGALYNSSGCTISKSVMNGNSADEGGAIHSNEELKIIESSLNDNKANSWGGAIYNFNDLDIVESELNGNSANYGGAIYNEGARLFIKAAVFGDNIANYGGAIYLRNYFDRESEFESESCSFTSNKPDDVFEKE